MRGKKPAAVTDWNKKGASPSMPPEAVHRIQTLRRLMLVHCYIYYVLGDNVISDHKWQEFADELVALQKQHGTQIGFYDEQFSDWDASTGYHLKYDADVITVAMRLLRTVEEYKKGSRP